MGSLFVYSLSTAIVLTLLYLVYKWLFADRNSHRLNRILIISIYVTALTEIPLYTWLSELALFQASPVTSSVSIDTSDMIQLIPAESAPISRHDWLPWIAGIYILGMISCAIFTISSLIRLVILISHSDRKVIDGYNIVVSDSIKYAPFSIGNIIVLSNEDFRETGDMIILHEKSHIALHHWFDLLIAQFVCIFQWYNPAAWIMRNELRAVHEYQADERVINHGIEVKEYQMLLIKKAVGTRFSTLANSLNHSKLKKRIAMMYNKNKSYDIWRMLAFIPVLALSVWLTHLPAVASVFEGIRNSSLLPKPESPISYNKAYKSFNNDKKRIDKREEIPNENENVYSVAENIPAHEDNDFVIENRNKPEKHITDNDQIVTAVEKMPEYIGGIKAMMQYIKENMKYPDECKKNGIQGRVIVRLAIDKEGNVGETMVIKPLNPLLDREAMRLVKNMKFHPAMNGGEPVAYRFYLPISFKNDSEVSNSESPVVTTINELETEPDRSYKQHGEKNRTKWESHISDSDRIFVNGKQLTGDINSVLKQLNEIAQSSIESISIDKSKRNGGKDIIIVLKS
jgi:TonB family protein